MAAAGLAAATWPAVAGLAVMARWVELLEMGRVVAGGTACPVVAGSAVMETSSSVDGVWRRGCEW